MLSKVLTLFTLSLAVTTVAAKECIVESGEGDDSPNILKAFADCSSDSVITFQPHNYSAFTPMTWDNLNNVIIKLDGNLLLPNNITAVQQAVKVTKNKPSSYATPWFYIQGTNVSLQGSTDPNFGAFHGFGQQWWDIGNRTLRPQLATFNVSTGSISHIKVIKPVAWGFNIPGTNVLVTNHRVDAKPNNGTRDKTTSFPFNTDGFNLSGQNITVDGYFGENGDDCISVINGARNITAKNGFCGFSSHGLSIGSLGHYGNNDTVANVLFHNWTMDGAVYGARFKSWTGGAGWAENITWEDITLVNVSTGVFITQNYYDQSLGGKPPVTNTSSTKINNFKYSNFKGYLNPNWTDGTCISNPCWNFVQGGDSSQSIIFDLYANSASNLQFTNFNVTPFNKNPDSTTVICDPATLMPGEQAGLGFNCTRGQFEVTAISGNGTPSAITANNSSPDNGGSTKGSRALRLQDSLLGQKILLGCAVVAATVAAYL